MPYTLTLTYSGVNLIKQQIIVSRSHIRYTGARFGSVAQSAEQRPLKPKVEGSIPSRPTNIDMVCPKNAQDC